MKEKLNTVISEKNLMKYAYKTELKPTKEQAIKIKESIDICRYLYNRYIGFNQNLYKMYQRGLLDDSQSYFMTAKDFDKYINNKVKIQEQYKWINKCGSKARKKAIVNAELAFKKYFQGKLGLPKFKRRDDQNIALYFPKNNSSDWVIERHRIKIPTIGFVRLKQYGYLPIEINEGKVVNGNVSMMADRFYISITVEKKDKNEIEVFEEDIKHKSLIVQLELNAYNKTIADLEIRINKAKRVLHQKYRKTREISSNQQKQKLKIKRLERRLFLKKVELYNQAINEIIIKKPRRILFPKLTQKEYKKDKSLLHKIYEFRNKLLLKCNREKIEIEYLTDLELSIEKDNQNIELLKVEIY